MKYREIGAAFRLYFGFAFLWYATFEGMHSAGFRSENLSNCYYVNWMYWCL